MRNEKQSAYKVKIKEEALNIADDFGPEFTEGLNVLLLLHRKKDGGDNKEHRRRLLTLIVNDTQQYIDALYKLLILKDNYDDGDYRVYATCNPRSLVKAERILKENMLANDFTGGDSKEHFYKRFSSNWVSALTNNKSRDRSYFLWDVDDNEDGSSNFDYALKQLAINEITEVYRYKTKNGWHVIVEPHPPINHDSSKIDIKKDSMILLKY